MSSELIVATNLSKHFRLGLSRKMVRAVVGIDFSVPRGDIFGFLGPNGAGKTTTIKMLTGLIRPSSGRAVLLGEEVPSARARQKVGFLPENPYIYPYLTPLEFVELCGGLSGLRGRALRDRSRHVLDRTGVLYAADRPARRLSKGMLQRTALAAALVADPELLILDEPMSGLDPVGRKEVKDLILEERQSGRTIFFSTHILADVEALCDRVVILRRGQVVVSGRLDDLLKGESQGVTVVLSAVGSELVSYCQAQGHALVEAGGRLRIDVSGRHQVPGLLERALASGASVEEVSSRHETLEELFVREAIGPDAPTLGARLPPS